MVCSFGELRCKEVIDVCNGCRVGYIDDIEIDTECGSIICLLVPSPGMRLPFSKGEPYRILWKDIDRIACDTIWVKLPIPPASSKKHKSLFFGE